MTEVFAKDCAKFDIIIEVKTLCRKSKTTPWAELVENGFKVADQVWEESDKVTKSSGEGHARLGLLTSYLTDVNRYLDPAIAKAILPEMSGLANGLGQIVLVGYVDGSEAPNPLLTTLFEFSQKPGERIKVSKNIQDCFKREDEIKALDSRIARNDQKAEESLFNALSVSWHVAYLGTTTPEWLCTLWNDHNRLQCREKITPKLTYTADDQDEFLRGRSFSSRTAIYAPGKSGKAHIVIHISEHVGEESDTVFVAMTEETGRGPILVMTPKEENPTDQTLNAYGTILSSLREFLDGQLYPKDNN